MNKDQKLLIVIISIIAILATAFGIYAYKHKGNNTCKNEDTDAIKFKREYEAFNGKKYDNIDKEYFEVKLSSNNLFKYVTEKEAVKFLKEGTGIIYFGFPQCPWCRTLVPYLEESAKANGIKEIKYLNILDIRDTYKIENKKAVVDKKGTDEYYKILDILDEYLNEFTVNENGKKYSTGVDRLYAPTIVVVKDGKIVAFHEGTVSTQEKFVPLSDDEQKELKNILNQKLSFISNTVCTDTAC